MKRDIKKTGKQFLKKAHLELMRKGIVFNPRRGSLAHEDFVYYLESSGKEYGDFPKLLAMYEQYRDDEIEEYLSRCKPKENITKCDKPNGTTGYTAEELSMLEKAISSADSRYAEFRESLNNIKPEDDDE